MNSRTLKMNIARALCAPSIGRLIGRIFADRLPFHGAVIDTGFHFVSPITKAQIFWKFYESGEIRFLHRYLRRDLDVVELGSSIGVMASQILRLQNPQRRLVCVEANATLIEALARNTAAASPGRVKIVSSAISYPEKEGAREHFAIGGSTIEGHVTDHKTEQSIEVQTTSLSRILHDADIEDYALISDIEGAEAGILEHDSPALDRCRQILIELHPTIVAGRAVSIDDLIGILVNRRHFRLLDRHGPVCAFER
jgi:FkbM family methyltransferase